jgi:hypothetical protein
MAVEEVDHLVLPKNTRQLYTRLATGGQPESAEEWATHDVNP